jgi:c-di-GMP-binding flagellar brake protein YcgR
MALSEACRLGDRIALCLVLPELPPVNLFITGEVRSRVDPIPGKESGYKTGIRFLDLKGEEQDLLVRYIFRKLRKELRGNKTPAYEPPVPS